MFLANHASMRVIADVVAVTIAHADATKAGSAIVTKVSVTVERSVIVTKVKAIATATRTKAIATATKRARRVR